MSSSKKHLSSKAPFIIGIIITVGIVGSFFLYKGKQQKEIENQIRGTGVFSDFEKAIRLENGPLAENFLPPQTARLATLNLLDSDQNQKIEKLINPFIKNKGESFNQLITGQLQIAYQTLLEPFQLDFTKDLAPLIGEKSRHTIAHFDLPNQPNNDLIAFTLSDLTSFDALTQKLITEKGGSEKKYQEQKIITAKDDKGALTLVGNLLLITNNTTSLEAALDFNKKDNLFTEKNYRLITTELSGPHLAFFYINQLAQSGSLSTSTFNELMSGGFILQAQADGLGFLGATQKNSTKNIFIAELAKPYLFKKITDDQEILYFESNNLKTKIENLSEQNKENASEENPASFDLEKFNEEFKQSTGKDFKEDILSFLNKGYAISIKNGEILPSISLLIDASAEPKKATEAIDLLRSQAEGVITLARLSLGESASAINLETAKVNGDNFNVINFDLAKLPEDVKFSANLPTKLAQAQIKIWYGLTSDNILVISITNDLNQIYQKNKASLFDKLITQLPEENKGLIYLSPAKLGAYIQKITELVEQFRPLTETEKAKISNFTNNVKYLQGGIFSFSQKDDLLINRGYLKIGE